MYSTCDLSSYSTQTAGPLASVTWGPAPYPHCVLWRSRSGSSIWRSIVKYDVQYTRKSYSWIQAKSAHASHEMLRRFDVDVPDITSRALRQFSCSVRLCVAPVSSFFSTSQGRRHPVQLECPPLSLVRAVADQSRHGADYGEKCKVCMSLTALWLDTPRKKHRTCVHTIAPTR